MKNIVFMFLITACHLSINCFAISIIPSGSTTLCKGDSVVLRLDTANALSYQWKKNGNDIKDATFSTYTTKDSGSYTVIAIYELFSKESNSIKITINLGPSVNIKFDTKKITCGVDSISYTLSPDGTAPFFYQWQHNGKNIIGATSNNFKILNYFCPDTGIYSCKISNSCDSIKVKVLHLYIWCWRYHPSLVGYVKYDNKDSTKMNSNNENTLTTVYLNIINNGCTYIDSTITDMMGNYIFTNLTWDTCKLTCKTKKAWGGSNPVDALLANRYYIGLFNIADTLKKQAADVNGDGKINPADALMINRRYIGLLRKFTISDWIFESPFVIVNGSDERKNIRAICRGDVNGSYVPK